MNKIRDRVMSIVETAEKCDELTKFIVLHLIKELHQSWYESGLSHKERVEKLDEVLSIKKEDWETLKRETFEPINN